jgi:hypothetical protein
MKNWSLRLFIGMALSAGLCFTRADTIVWAGANSGNWSVGSNWNPQHAPGPSDIAVITNSGNYTVTLDVSASVSGLVLGATDGSTQIFFINGQTFTLAGLATVNSGGLLNLSSGTFNGNTNSGGAVLNGMLTCSGGALAGELTVSSNSVLYLATSAANALNGLSLLTNSGTVTWISGNLSGTGSHCEIDNYGLWNVQSNNYFYGGSGTTFNNYGIFLKSGGPYGSGQFTILDGNVAFNNFGTVDVQSWGLQISAGVGTGIFNPTSGAILTLSSSYILTGDPVFTGGGLTTGYLNGSNAVVHGTVTSGFGLSLSGTLMLVSNAVLNMTPGSSGTPPVNLSSLSFTNYGTVNWGNVNFSASTSGQIYNYGLWDDQTNNTFSGDGTIFNNYGTFRKSGGPLGGGNSPVTTIDQLTTFNNYGTMDVQTGFVDILGGGAGSGIFNTAQSNSAIELVAYVLTGNPTLTGNFSGQVTGTNLVVQGAMHVSYVTFSGTMTIASNAVFYSGPASGSGGFQGGILTNYGVVVLTGDLTCQSGPQFYNYGLWDNQTNNTFYGANSGSGTSTFNNYGIFRKSGGAGGQTLLDANTAFNNSGTVDVQTGQLRFGGSYSLAGGTLNFGISSLNNYGSIMIAGNAALSGSLSVNLNNNYSPVAGSSFALLISGSEAGIFNAINVPHLSGLIWQTNYNVTSMAGTMFLLSVTNLPPPQLSSTATQSSGSISLSWNALAGQTYQFQYTTNLAPVNWVNLGDIISGTNGTMTASDVIGQDPQRFYRLIVLP